MPRRSRSRNNRSLNNTHNAVDLGDLDDVSATDFFANHKNNDVTNDDQKWKESDAENVTPPSGSSKTPENSAKTTKTKGKKGKKTVSVADTPSIITETNGDATPSGSKRNKEGKADETPNAATPSSSKKVKKHVEETPEVSVINDTIDLTQSSSKKKNKKKNKKAAEEDPSTPLNVSYNTTNAGNTPLTVFNTTNAGSTPKSGAKQNGASVKAEPAALNFEDDDNAMDTSVGVDDSFVTANGETPTSSKTKRRRNKKKKKVVIDVDEADGSEEVVSVEKEEAIEPDVKNEVSPTPEVAPTNSRKRKAAQRAQQSLALVPADRMDDTDPDDSNYIVESPDEDGEPKRARVEESESDDDSEELSPSAIRRRITNLFAGGIFFDDDDEDEGDFDPAQQYLNEIDPGYEDSDASVVNSSDSDDSSGLIEAECDIVDDDNDEDEESGESADEWNAFDLDDVENYSEIDSDGESVISNVALYPNNSDEEIEQTIASIRHRGGETVDILDDFYEQGIGHTSDETSDDDDDIMGPVDDLEELEDADDADLDAEDDADDDGEDLDGFIDDEPQLQFIENDTDADDDDDEDEDEDDEDDDDDMDIDLESDDADANEISAYYKIGEKFKFDVEGYQIYKDRTLLVSVGRTSGPKTREGLMLKPFTFNIIDVRMDENSVDVGKSAFNWMIAPSQMETFYGNVFQRRVFHIARRDHRYYDGLFSSDRLLQIIQDNNLKYEQNINVAFYTPEGGRETHNLEGRVFAQQIKAFFADGKSIQFINPQSYDDTVWYLCEILQEMTNNFVGANTYLTPAESAGFAPHWDEVDAFIMQVEGSKKWRVWAPLDGDEVLPDESSRNFTEDEMKSRDLVYEGVLHAGDLLYIPRGFYHAAHATKEHSLHVTISFCHNVTFTHLLKGITDEVWDSVRRDRLLARRSVPPHFLEMNGVANLDYDSTYDEHMLPVINTIIEDLVVSYREAIPSAVDNMAMEFFRQALPPMLNPYELANSVHGHNGSFEDPPLTISRMKEIRFIRMHTQRLLYQTESDPFIVHRMSNSRILAENTEPHTIKIETNMVDGVLTLCKEYPNWIKVKDLGCGKRTNVELANLLFLGGVIMVREAK